MTISGIVDLVHVTRDQVEIVDYKTDRGRHAESKYRKQLSVYYYVAVSQYPDRTVTANIFYTGPGVRHPIEPLSTEQLKSVVRKAEPAKLASSRAN